MLKNIFVILIVLFATSTTAVGNTSDKKLGKFLGASNVQMPSWFKDSFLDLKDDLIEESKKDRYVLIYFHQNGCPYCSKLVNDNFHNEKFVTKLRKNFAVIDINMWGNKEVIDWTGREFDEKSFAKFMNIQFTPSLLFLEANGNVIIRLNGYQSVAKMNIVLDYIIGKHYEKTNFANYRNSLAVPKPLIHIELSQPSYFDTSPFILSRSKQLPAQKPLTVIFTESDCIECNKFYNEFLLKPENTKLLKKTQVVQLNLKVKQKIITPSGKKTTASNWYQSLKLTDVPAMVFFDKFGNEIIRKDAYLKHYHFESLLDYVANKGYKKYSNFQRFIEHRSTMIRQQGIDVNIWK